jgi:hypothetical protein
MPRKKEKNTLKIRRAWRINPKTRVKKSDKIYKRSREERREIREIKQETEDELASS